MTEPKRQKGNWKHVDGGRGFVIPYTLLRHENWKRLGPHACKLMLDLARQFSGFNNGYQCPAWDLMRREGWKSRETLFLAIEEAVHYGLISQTRQGGRNRANLYALTWWPIHAKPDDPLDVTGTTKATNAWKEARPKFELPEGLRQRRERGKAKYRSSATKIELPAERAA